METCSAVQLRTSEFVVEEVSFEWCDYSNETFSTVLLMVPFISR